MQHSWEKYYKIKIICCSFRKLNGGCKQLCKYYAPFDHHFSSKMHFSICHGGTDCRWQLVASSSALENFPFRPCCFCVRKMTRQQTLTFQRLQHLDFTILLKKETNTNRESHAETMAKQQKAFCTGKKKERKLLEIYTFTCSFIKMFNFINLC